MPVSFAHFDWCTALRLPHHLSVLQSQTPAWFHGFVAAQAPSARAAAHSGICTPLSCSTPAPAHPARTTCTELQSSVFKAPPVRLLPVHFSLGVQGPAGCFCSEKGARLPSAVLTARLSKAVGQHSQHLCLWPQDCAWRCSCLGQKLPHT